MATRLRDILEGNGAHDFGALNTKWAKQFANGGIASGNMDNYTLAVRDGRDSEGNIKFKQKSANTADAGGEFLITTVEEEELVKLVEFQEGYRDFYNKAGDPVRATMLTEGVRFETSAITKNTGVTDMVKGMVAHFDVATRKYIISASGSAHADFAGAIPQFEVVEEDSDLGYAFEVDTVRLMVTKAK